jgi:hypothetical protein
MRMRVGVTLWALSWVPYGLILGLAGVWLTLAWGFEIALGLVGIAVAGAEFSRAVKGQGWKRAPGIAWHAFRHGESVEA